MTRNTDGGAEDAVNRVETDVCGCPEQISCLQISCLQTRQGT